MFNYLQVEKSMNGVSIGNRMKTIGMKGISLDEVIFDKTVIPRENVVYISGKGADVHREMVINDRYFAGAQIAAALRTLISAAVKHTIRREIYQTKMWEVDLIKNKLTSMAVKLYALESAVYMTAGLADVQKTEDIGCEAAITKYFALKCTREIAHTCSTLLGEDYYI